MADDNRPSGDKEPSGNNWMKSLMIWAGIILALVLVVQLVGGGAAAPRDAIPYSEFLNKVDDGSVKQVVIGKEVITGRLADDRTFRTNAPSPIRRWSTRLREHGVASTVQPERDDLALDAPALPVAALPADPRHRLLRDAPDAEECGLGRDGLRPLQGQIADREARPRHLRRRRRDRRGARGIAGDRRVPEGPDQVRPARRQDPQGRAAGRLARHRQDAAGARDRRRGQRPLLHHFGLGLRRDVRRRRRQPRARHVRAGQEERPLHRLHRRDRRGRPPSRRRPRQRQ